MSYSTRTRQGGTGIGRGSTAQVLYHQQAPRGGHQQQSRQGYSSQPATPGNQDYTKGYQTQPNPPFNQQQYQQQKQQQPPPEAPTPTKSILKQSPTTPNPLPQSVPAVQQEETKSQEQNGGVKEEEKVPWFKKHKKAGFKVNKIQRRRRLNARLHRLLMPKNATMVLNELKEDDKIRFTVTPPANLASFPCVFVAQAHFFGKDYIGEGKSKMAAKQAAAENALRSYMMEKMQQEKEKKDTEPVTEDEEMPDTSSDAGDKASKKRKPPAEEDFPWGPFASFALYKLFEEWQTLEEAGISPSEFRAQMGKFQPPFPFPFEQTFQRPGPPAFVANPTKKTPSIEGSEQNPVQVLNQMKPGLAYVEVSRVPSTDKTLLFTMRVEVDGQVYQGVGKNKREAKREAAKSALRKLLNVNA